MIRRLILTLVLLVALCGSAWAAPEQWIEVSSSHFTLLTDSSEKEGRHLLDQFERMRWMFQKLFPKLDVDPIQPIVIIAAKNQKTFQTLEPAAYLAKGSLHLAGLFLRTPDKNYVLVRLDTDEEHPFATVYHEYTHLQLGREAEWLPIWLNEGWAEFIQNTDIHDKDVQIGKPSVNDIVYLRQNRLIPLPVLFRVDANSPYYHEEDKGSVFYAESWALTHMLFLRDRVKGTHTVDDYTAMVQRHMDPVEAGEKAFGDLKKLQSDLESYLAAGSYKQLVLSSAAAPIDQSSYQARTLTPNEAAAVRADFLANVQRYSEARELLDAVLKADPNNAQARETMGFLEMREGHMDAAQRWYAEAVKLDSHNYLAHYYFASMAMRDGGGAQEKEIEASLRAAIRLNPRFAPAYDLLASFLARQAQNLDEAAHLSAQAIQLEPANLGYRMDAANVLMAMRNYADAAAVLRNSAKLAKSPHESAMLQNRIAEMEEYQTLRLHAGNSDSGVVDIAAPEAGGSSAASGQIVTIVPADEGPKHPSEANGPKHEATGVIRGVKCSYPSVIEFRVEGAKTVSVYSNNYYKLDFTMQGSTPPSSLRPCDQIEGMKARVQYAESADKTVDGQAIAVELRK